MSEVKIPFYGHVRQYHNLKEDIDKAIVGVLESGTYTMGPAMKKFEGELAQYMGMKHAIGLNSGTDALWLAFLAMGLGKGDEIITTSNTFFATAEAIWLIGATPVFVDCEADTRNIDVTKIEEKITSKTKGIVPVHLYGQPANMPAIAAIAKKHNLIVVEDCAQAFGAAGDSWKIGQYSDAVATSFITAKNLGCFGDGGAVFTNRDDIVEPIIKMRNHGSNKRSHHSVGWNSRLDDIQAAVLSVKLKHIDEFNNARIKWAKLYDELLASSKLKLPKGKAGYRHVYHLYVIENVGRDDLQEFLKERGIIALTNYPVAIHEQEGFPFSGSKGLSWQVPGITESGDPKPVLPECEKNSAQCLSLPMYPELTEQEVKFVAASVLEWEKGPGAKYVA
ncbi:MAG: DegT/DnrJ/EryC1/StrS family aminotransferase [Lysobacterales bacterium]|nr:MAG: DegT/DnrJ/EryC1/StrS family aminotransferase [Xanthomonadales bacterium]